MFGNKVPIFKALQVSNENIDFPLLLNKWAPMEVLLPAGQSSVYPYKALIWP